MVHEHHSNQMMYLKVLLENRSLDRNLSTVSALEACLDANGQAKDENGNGVMKPWYEVTEADQDAILKATTWNPADFGYFRGGGYSSRFVTE